MSIMRLDKYLTDAGIGTRSQVKSFIRQKAVSVNDTTATRPEQKITPGEDIVKYRGKTISLSIFEYFILNKPAGYVTAVKDNVHPTVMSLIDSGRKDLAPVGRLDKDTEGLLLITNDGALAHKLLSPKHHAAKTYYAVLDKSVGVNEAELFSKGIEINDEDPFTALPAVLKPLDEPLQFESDHYNNLFLYNDVKNSNATEDMIKEPTQKEASGNTIQEPLHKAESEYVLITIQEGKFHQVKRMFKAVDRTVLYLRRISFGGIKLPEDLETGKSIRLSADEIEGLIHFNDLKC